MPRRLLIESGIRFEEGVSNEDVLWTAEVFASAKAIKLLGDPLYHYIVRDGSITNSFSHRVTDVFDNCRKLEDFVASRFPSLKEPCARYCARACWNVMLVSSRKGNKKRYPDVHRRAMHELVGRKKAVTRYCNTPKDRILLILVKTGVYGLLKK